MSEINNESGYYKALKIAGTVLLKIFLAPGRILLWNRYMYAKPGSIAISARQRKSLPHAIFFSFIFWCIFIYIATADDSTQSKIQNTPNNLASQKTEQTAQNIDNSSRSQKLPDSGLTNIKKHETSKQENPAVSSFSTRDQVF